MDNNSLSHTKWNCKYHIVFAPKFRRKIIYGKLRQDIANILSALCKRKGVKIVEAEMCPDHVHMLVEIPPSISVSSFVGYLKGKSTLMIFERHANLKYKFGNRHFWCRGYYVDTVGKNAKKIQEYIQNQLKEDLEYDQMTLSYKVHKTIERPVEDYQVIPNTQEAIISENTWLRVQELRKSKRRNTATGRKSLFSGLVYCPDCGAKLHFCAAKSLKKNQEFWRCSSYKDGRGTCTIHYIRDVVLEAIVKEAISELADFVRCYNSAFLYLIAEKKGAEAVNQEKSLRAKTENARQRISDLDKLFSRIYEDNILGKLSDERYSRMASEYEAEQKQLISEVEANEKTLIELQKQTVDMKMLYQGLMEFTEMKQLTPTIVNKLIERIEIHNNEKKHSHGHVKVDIYFTAVGLFDIPTEQQLLETMERVKQKNAEKSA